MWVGGGRRKALKKRHISVNTWIYPVEKRIATKAKAKCLNRQERVFPVLKQRIGAQTVYPHNSSEG